MSIFSQLLKLIKLESEKVSLEDFFTEIVAHCWREHPDILVTWLQLAGITEQISSFQVKVITQRIYQHPETEKPKRPDIVLELTKGNQRNVVFIESKIASKEGIDEVIHIVGTDDFSQQESQLNAYAKVLSALEDHQNRYLIYATRDFDPKESDKVLQNISKFPVKFLQLRWHRLYQVLCDRSETYIIREIKLFMEEHQIAQKHQFSPTNLLSLFHLPEALALMNAAMWGEAFHTFNDTLNDQKSEKYRKRQAWQQISFRHRYFMSVDMPENWSCHMGFQFQAFRPSAQKPFNPKDYPNVCLILQVSPDSGSRSEIVNGMRTIANEFGWQEYELDQRDAWSGIFLSKSLAEFLAFEDHIDSIENFFIEGLEQLRIIKEKYSELPWEAALIS